MTSENIQEIQTFLNIINQGKPGWVPLAVDGNNGPKTSAAIKAYQTANNLTPDGIVGPLTLASMQTTYTNHAMGNTGGSTTNTDPNAPFDANQSTYTVKAGDKFNPYNGQPLNNVTPGTVINKSGTSTSGSGVSTSLYGRTERMSDWEGPALQQQKWASETAEDMDLVSTATLNKIAADPSVIGFYVNALSYGGYTIGDVLNDMKRRELADKGDTKAKSLKIIDAEMPRTQYQATAEGQKSVTDAASIIPTFNMQGLMNPEILKYGANMPDELFKTLVPLLDRDSQEFKDAVENVKSAFYDLANAQLQATTEQEKAVADYNYKNFKEQIEAQYGIALSDDATKAWQQIESLRDTMSTRGIQGSGIEAEGIDDILKDARKRDQRMRFEKLSREEQEKASYYTSSASAAEIAKLSDEDKIKYGLKPSADVLAQYDMANLKAKYPNQSEAELKAYRDAVLDENGNYRSNLYAKKFSKMSENITNKKALAEGQVLTDAMNDELRAYRNYDQSDPFSAATKSDNEQMEADAEATPNPKNQGEPIKDTPLDPKIINFNSNNGVRLQPGESFTDQKTGKTYKQGDPFNSTQYATEIKTTTPTQTSSGPLSIAQIQKIVGVKEDGINGPKTQAAIKAYQTANGLVPDGIVGPKTLSVMQSKSTTTPTQTPTPTFTQTPTSTPTQNPTTTQSYSAPISAAFNPNNGQPLYVGQTTTFQGKTYTGSTPKATTSSTSNTSSSSTSTAPKITAPTAPKPTSTSSSSAQSAAFNPNTGKPLYVGQTTTFQGITYKGTTPK